MQTISLTNDASADQALITSIDKDIDGVTRRLFEAALLCKLFEKTNSTEHFEHFLILTDLEQIRTKIKDDEIFYGQQNQFFLSEALKLDSEIASMEAAIPSLTNAWYIKDQPKKRFQRPGGFFSSVATRFIRTLPELNELERLIFGFSYDVCFGNTSRSIHFNASKIYSPAPPNREIVLNALYQCFGLASIALCSCNKLTDSRQPRVAEFETHYFSQNEITHIKTKVLKNFELGDIVRVHSSLAEISQIHEKVDFGYKSYSVSFLEDPPIHPNDWFIPAHLFMYFAKNDRRDLINSFNQKLLSNAFQEQLKKSGGTESPGTLTPQIFFNALNAALSPEQVDEYFRNIVRHTWRIQTNQLRPPATT